LAIVTDAYCMERSSFGMPEKAGLIIGDALKERVAHWPIGRLVLSSQRTDSPLNRIYLVVVR
jgi:hypothetical protein